MSLSPKLNSVIAGEIRTWQQEALISPELGETLLARYPITASGSMPITVLTIVGAVLLGLGGLLFIASNWAAMTAGVKLSLIVCAVIACHFVGWQLRYEPGKRPKVGAALMLLGSLFYGAGIWLVAQIFNMDLAFEQGLLLWALGAAAVTVVTRCGAHSVLTSILLMCAAPNVSGLNLFGGGSETIQALAYRMVLGFIVVALLSYWTRSRASFAIGAIVSTVGLGCYHPYFGMLVWGVVLLCGYLVGRNRWQIGTRTMMYLGAISVFSALMTFTLPHVHSWWSDNIGNPWLTVLLPVIALLSGFYTAAQSETRWEGFACLFLVLVPEALQALPQAACLMLTNVVLFALLLAVILSAQRRLQEPALVNLSIAGLVIFVMCRYFDFFFSMMDRSLAFTVGGVLLMLIGALAERSRRRLLGEMN